MVPTELLTSGPDLIITERRAITNNRFRADQCRTLCFRSSRLEGLVDRARVLAVDIAQDMSAIRLEAFGRVIREPAAHVAINGNPVIVVHPDQLAETQGASQRADLMRYPSMRQPYRPR